MTVSSLRVVFAQSLAWSNGASIIFPCSVHLFNITPALPAAAFATDDDNVVLVGVVAVAVAAAVVVRGAR